MFSSSSSSSSLDGQAEGEALPSPLSPRSARRLGASYWFPLFGGALQNYALIASPREFDDAPPCTLRGVNDGAAFQIAFPKAALVAWFHDQRPSPNADQLFEWLCEHARIWELEDPGSSDDADTLAHVTHSYVVSAPLTTFPSLEDDERSESVSKRKRDASDDDEVPVAKKPRRRLCTGCYRHEAQDNHALCPACRRSFAEHNMTPPGRAHTRNGTLRKLCSQCHTNPARKRGAKCESCSYSTNKTKCLACGQNGRKITKGYCGTCIGKRPKD